MKPFFSLFPKMLGRLTMEGLADTMQQIGLDGVDLVVRDGYWVTPGGFTREAPAFVRGMQSRGIRVELATTSYTPEALAKDATPLAVMSEIGIKSFRTGYFAYRESVPLREQLEQASGELEQLAELCAKYRMKAIYQVHHGYSQLIQHSFAALAVAQGLPPEHIGFMLDPGNQFHEGREHTGKAIELLGDYFAAIGVKDVMPSRDPNRSHMPDKGWSAAWTPCDEGMLNWRDIGAAVSKLDRPVIINMQPFYHPQNQEQHIAALSKEFAYIRQAFGEAVSEHERA
ncbi:sugar phosphate isomerase/epimerase family protein [Paenibacillus ginsengarvi]|uniref:Xylose isomerase-like TIM barrel domain-containing protein n=1 Tax=Paenibacillus ginsengarvi TaxID=400777 RepID=A0A3B0CG98_9BACL|nr:TIM barrel protein [Paenibacillus ginsengarvi]RKN83908.1 hypothetical protein D7M11_15090 [Paenibacillus ginsengarvi]